MPKITEKTFLSLEEEIQTIRTALVLVKSLVTTHHQHMLLQNAYTSLDYIAKQATDFVKAKWIKDNDTLPHGVTVEILAIDPNYELPATSACWIRWVREGSDHFRYRSCDISDLELNSPDDLNIHFKMEQNAILRKALETARGWVVTCSENRTAKRDLAMIDKLLYPQEM